MNTKDRLYQVATVGIFLGVAMLCQPFDLDVFSAGFPTLLASVVLFMILDHVDQ